MCIINEPAEVTNTEIFVSPNEDNSRQIVIYTNKVSTQHHNNAMILPVPHPSTIKLHDLSYYKDIFEDCGKSFPSKDYGTLSANFALDSSRNSSDQILEVHHVGSYEVSIVPTYDDFHRLNRHHFQLNTLVGSLLKKYYNIEFGYLVCKLKTGEGNQYHPLAYSHKIYRNNQMFVPTRHHHSTHEEKMSHYDHNIYSVNTKSLCGNEKWNYRFKVKTEKIPNFRFPTILCFNKFSIKKEDLNTDIYFYLDSHIEPFGQHHGPDGCVFKANHPEITFKNRGSIYIQPLYRGLPFYKETMTRLNYDNHGLQFAGTGTTFVVNGNQIKVIDDIGTELEHELNFEFNPYADEINPGVYMVEDRGGSWPRPQPQLSVPHGVPSGLPSGVVTTWWDSLSSLTSDQLDRQEERPQRRQPRFEPNARWWSQ